jgi:DNA helicase HerA-like ATPase
MPHTLIIGKTGSGKTTLAKKIVEKAHKRGVNKLILDPTPARHEWPHDDKDFITNDPDEFLQVVFANTRCLGIVDEAGSMIGRFGKEKNNLATMSRHYGHSMIFITQDVKSIDNIVREQMQDIIVFRVGKKRADELAEDFADDDLKQASTLQKGEFLIKQDFRPVIRDKVF